MPRSTLRLSAFASVILCLGCVLSLDLLGTLPFLNASDVKLNSTTTHYVNSHNQTTTTSHNKYAYAFVIGGCNPDTGGGYRGFLYNILIATKILKDEGSQADVVAFFQMDYDSSYEKLPTHEEAFLRALGIRIEYIPKSATQSFYETILDKFRILTLVEYRRVLFLDGDVLPLGNLDYFFELSDGPHPTLKENVVVGGKNEPSNAGFFMLAPQPGDYDELLEIIKIREEKAANLTGRIKFDVVEGWGHKIEPPDKWRGIQSSGRNWTFTFAYLEQGLLYYWVKYTKKSVSLFLGGEVENWSTLPNGTLYRETLFYLPHHKYTKLLLHDSLSCQKWRCDFKHFTGPDKPWLGPKPPETFQLTETQSRLNPWNLWYYTLAQLNEQLGMGLNLSSWQGVGKPTLGFYAKNNQVNRHIDEHATTRTPS